MYAAPYRTGQLRASRIGLPHACPRNLADSQQKCGTLNSSHYLHALWTFSLVIAEIQQILYNKDFYFRQSGSLVDILSILFGCCAVSLRFHLASHPDGNWVRSNANDMVEFFHDRHRGVRPGAWYEASATGQPSLYPEDVCVWSLELELLRLMAATTMIFTCLRLMEHLSLGTETGKLMYCIFEMISGDLSSWIWPTFILVLAFALALSQLAPYYQADSSSGPFR